MTIRKYSQENSICLKRKYHVVNTSATIGAGQDEYFELNVSHPMSDESFSFDFRFRTNPALLTATRECVACL